jgi:hypothetical protein
MPQGDTTEEIDGRRRAGLLGDAPAIKRRLSMDLNP